MSQFTNQLSSYVQGSLSQLANEKFSTYAMSLLSDAASLFTQRSIGSGESYDAFLDYVSLLGHNPRSVFGKSYPYLYMDMVGNNARADELSEGMFNFKKFTFYKNKPDIVLSDPENDVRDYFGQFIPDIPFSTEMKYGYEIKYAEEDGVFENFLAHPGDAHGGVGNFNSVPSSLGANDLIVKTNQLFNEGKMKTLIARFHTTDAQSTFTDNPLQTAISKVYGMSHGRNLLSGSEPSNNGYDNPYCRTWTYHHQYKDYARALRPFVNWSNDGGDNLTTLSQSVLNDKYSWYAMGNNGMTNGEAADFDGMGRSRLDKLGVLSNKTGKVNIAPVYKSIDDQGNYLDSTQKIVDVKNCMFSLENLAWKVSGRESKWFDINGLSDEQKGPMGGRIMWFPPYNIKFNETITSNWKNTPIIGRGEEIYTYTNTIRSGHLSFDMLIDHPSVLDYWKGWQENGQRNNGHSLSPLNEGGVDNPDNQEQTLLRFFAGCDILEATPRQCKVKKPKKKIEPAIETVDSDEPANGEPKKLIFFAYFPNNYSGKDDNASDAIRYLMNGIGSQRGSQLVSADTVSGASLAIEDVPVSIQKIKVNGTEISGGYEMTNDSVDLCTAQSVQDLTYQGYPQNCEYTDYITTGTPGTRAYQYEYVDAKGQQQTSPLQLHTKGLTLTGCPIQSQAIQFQYGDGQLYLAAKYIGSNALKSYASNKEHYLYRWYYRIDSDTQNQLLKTPHGYIDGASYQLNSTGYEAVKEYMSETLSEDSSNTSLVSLSDVFIVSSLDSQAKEILAHTDNNVALAQSVLNEEQNIKIQSIHVYGAASNHGNKQIYNAQTKKVESVPSTDITRNNTLAENRAKTVGEWFKAAYPSLSSLVEIHNDSKSIDNTSGNKAVYNTSILKEFGASESPSDVDNKKEKIYRSAAVIIEYTQESVTNASEVNSPTQTSAELTGDSPSLVKVTPKEYAKAMKEERKTQLAYEKQQAKADAAQMEAARLQAEVDKIREEMEKEGTLTQASQQEQEAIKQATLHADEVEQEDEFTWKTMPRYDNEGEFFKELQTHDPNMMHLISQKVRYFEPAYHAISPEGFAARLTFLQQCARQGNTISASDANSITANNLSFGAPPVCVLRLGDFYYTRIIIDSISIEYDPLMWDLNHEGIGVMPMMAHITLQFKFIGGSDLSGPISRLQNAVSFNYYANTSVYDNRAEQVKYTDNGVMTHFKPFEVEQSQSDDNVTINDKMNKR